jgi:hypothetical protein
MHKWIFWGGGGRVAGEEEYTHIFILWFLKTIVKPIAKSANALKL